MSHSLYATDAAVDALAAAKPELVDVVPAGSVVGHLEAGGVCHAGPPISAESMCPPMRAALGAAMALEGLAPSAEAALALADAGAVALAPSHDHGGVGPMSGVVTASMPVLVARDASSGRIAWSPLNEGSGRVLRYGADGPEVIERLAWMRESLGPALARALAAAGPLDLVELMSQALGRGDECHHRTEASTELVHERLGRWLDGEAAAFILGNGQFALNLAMVASKLALACAEGVQGSALVTVLARNGVEVGVKLSGTGDRWFVGPAALPSPAALFEGYAPEDMNPDLGDSAIVEAYGLGALAIAASPLSAGSVGLDPAGAVAITQRLRAIAAGAHPTAKVPDADGMLVPAILGVDARAVVRERMLPPVHTGIAHRRPGIGQIGGGVTHPPMQAFDAAVAALDAT